MRYYPFFHGVALLAESIEFKIIFPKPPLWTLWDAGRRMAAVQCPCEKAIFSKRIRCIWR